MCWTRRGSRVRQPKQFQQLELNGVMESDRMGDNKAGIMQIMPRAVKQSFETLTACVGLAFFSQLHPPGDSCWRGERVEGVKVASPPKEPR